MKSKEQLKQEFKNLQKPDENDFSELIESYFHRDVPITLEELSMLKANLATIDKTNDGTETLGNVDTKEQVNAKINFAINALKANAPETYDTLKEIADYIANDSNAEAALLQLINTKLDKPNLDNNNVGRWNTSTGNFVNGTIQDDGTKIGIGTAVDSGTSPARVKLAHLNSKYFNITDSSAMGTPATLNYGDVYGVNGDIYIYLNAGNNGTTNDKKGNVHSLKLTGLQNDYITTTTNSAAGMAKFVDMKRFFTYGTHLALSGYLYGNTVLGNYVSQGGDVSTGLTLETSNAVHPDMYAGALYTAGETQLYIDLKGSIFSRGNSSALGGDGIWKKQISEKQNTITVLSEKVNATKGLNTKDLSFTLQSSITPTPNTLVPKTDGSRPLWFDNSSLKHEVALKEDIGNRIFLDEYIHNSNQEIYFSSFDYTTGIGVTTIPHGLNIGSTYSQCIIVPNSFKNLDENDSLLQTEIKSIPYEYLRSVIIFTVVDANTLKLSDWNGGGSVITVNQTSTENNGNLTTIGWHLEIQRSPNGSPTGYAIFGNLPINTKRISIEVLMCSYYNFSGSGARSLGFYYYDNNNAVVQNTASFFNSNIGWGAVGRINNNSESIISQTEINLSLNNGLGYYSVNEIVYGRNSGIWNYGNLSTQSGIIPIKRPANFNGIAKFILGNGWIKFANGTRFKIYTN